MRVGGPVWWRLGAGDLHAIRGGARRAHGAPGGPGADAAVLLSATVALAAPPGKGAALLAEAPAGVRARVQAFADAARAHLARPAPRAPLSKVLVRDLEERFGALSARQADALRALVVAEVARASGQPGQDRLLQAFQPEQGQARAVARVLEEDRAGLLAVLRGLKAPAR